MPRLLARLTTPTATIFPFADEARNLLFGGPTLDRLQRDEAAAAGLDVVDVDDGGAFPDGTVAAVARDVVFNAATLTALIDVAQQKQQTLRAAVKPTTALYAASTRLTDFDGPLAVPLIAGALAGKRVSFDDANDVVVADEDGAAVFASRPYGKAPHALRIARVKRLLGRPTHWLHVLDLSLAALQTRLAHPTTTTTQQTALQKRDAKKTFVHPHAYVENSVLGAGVRVEAGASVIDSVVGDDVIVADHTVVHGSVIGDGCRTLVDTHLRRVVAMPGSTLSNLDMQDAIFGREIFLTTGVAFFADGPGRDVVVDGRDSGRAVLAGAIGARAVLGSRALFRAGVALPPRVLVVAKAGEAVGKTDTVSLERSWMKHGDRTRDV